MSENAKKFKSSEVKLPENTVKEQKINSDENLWQDFLNGSETAIAKIYAKYVPVLFNYGNHIIHNEALVSDCIQDVFFELIDKRKKLSSAISVKFYLISSLRRRLLRQITKDKKYVSGQDNEHLGFLYKIEPEVIQISTSYSLDEKSIIEKACNSLPKKQREAIMLYFFQGLSYKEIAEIFEFSNPKNARTLIYRALDSLATKLSVWKNELLIFLLFLLSSLIS